jgi:hypothetical protein
MWTVQLEKGKEELGYKWKTTLSRNIRGNCVSNYNETGNEAEVRCRQTEQRSPIQIPDIHTVVSAK